MRPILAATAIVFAMTGAANAAGTYWMGNMFPVSVKCTAPGSGSGGDFSQVIFSPKGLPGNSAKHDMAVFFSFGKLGGAQMIPTEAVGTFNGTKLVAITAIGMNGYSTAQMKVTSSTFLPKAPTAADTYITGSMTFTQPDGCVITSSGTLVRWGG